EIDAIVNVDPVINLLESQGLIKVVADTRTLAGTREVFGGAYPAAVLYAPRAFIAEKPRTTQALVNALVRAQMDRGPIGRGGRRRDAVGLRARQRGALPTVGQDQPADLFPRRPLFPRSRRDRLRRAQGVRSRRRQRQDRRGGDLHQRI